MVPEKKPSPEQDRGGRRGRTGVTKGAHMFWSVANGLTPTGRTGRRGTEGRRRGTTVVMWRRRGRTKMATVPYRLALLSDAIMSKLLFFESLESKILTPRVQPRGTSPKS
ncbi:hypothetical protein Hdeb2414_s0004g00127661 [Helianthus debilis subsp. tardiflorus]